MERFKQILVSIVGEHAESAAVQRGARLARSTGAALKLVDVTEDFPWYARLVLPNVDELQEIVVRQKTARLEALAAPIRRNGGVVTVKLLHGRPELETIREVLRGGHDLLLKDALDGECGPFTSSGMHLLRNCPCPVWLVRPEQGGRLFTQILAAVDPTPEEMAQTGGGAEYLANPLVDPTPEGMAQTGETQLGHLSVKILELATSLAEWEGAGLDVVHAWEAPAEGLLRRPGGSSEMQIRKYVESVQTEVRKNFDQLLAPFQDRISKAQVHLVRGPASEVISKFAADQEVDLIIMGTVARTGVAGLVIGNTAETILQCVQCSVLALKPDGFISPVTLGD